MTQHTPSPSPTGILAIWNDCAPGQEALYERWYRTEHLAERLAIPGFRSGRRFRRLSGTGPQYFTCYETDSPEVLYSVAYQERVQNPTDLTRQAMSGVLVNVSRTICRVVRSDGAMRGGFAVTATISSAAVLQAMADRHPAAGDVVRTEIWHAEERPEGGPNTEQQIRGRDSRIEGCLLIETASAESARQGAQSVEDLSGCHARAFGLMHELFA